MLDEANRPADDLRRAPVVRHEVDATEPGKGCREIQDTPNVGEAPCVDRLVVIADQEDPVAGSGEEQREPELAPIHVLHLVDEEMLAPLAPPAEEGRVSLERPDRTPDEIVEIQRGARGERGLVAEERAHDPAGRLATRFCLADLARERLRIDAQVELQSREAVVEPLELRRRQVALELAKEPDPVCERFDRHPGIDQDLAAQRVEGADADRTCPAAAALAPRGA